MFHVGYNEVREKVGNKYTMSCFNCEHYYQAYGDSTEMCQNPDVIKFDIIVTDTGIYCTHWEISKREPKELSVKRLFKNGQV